MTNQQFIYQLDKRQQKGLDLYRSGNVAKYEGFYIVKSGTSESSFYEVINETCNCPDFQTRGKSFKKCKHIHAVDFYNQTHI